MTFLLLVFGSEYVSHFSAFMYHVLQVKTVLVACLDSAFTWQFSISSSPTLSGEFFYSTNS